MLWLQSMPVSKDCKHIQAMSLVTDGRICTRAGKNLRFFKKDFRSLGFLGFLGFNVCTGARGTLDTRIRSRRMPTRRLTHALRYKIIATPMNSNEFTEFDMKKVKILT